MSTELLFVIVTLASLRVTRMFTRDTIFDGPRNHWWSKFPPKDEYEDDINAMGGGYAKVDTYLVRKAHKLGMLIDCPWCIGFWVSGIIVLITSQLASMPLPVLWWLAVAAGQAFIHGYEK
jgi:hypothetical protein